MPLVPSGNPVGPLFTPGSGTYADGPDSQFGGGSGPFAYGGDLYVVGAQQSLGNEKLEVWKKNPDSSWSIVDVSNQPDLASGGAGGGKGTWYAVQDGATLHIVHTAPEVQLAVSEFDLSTDSWTSTVAGGPSIATTRAWFSLMAERLSTGEIKAYYSSTTDRNSEAGTVHRVSYSAGTWGTPVAIGGSNVRLDTTILDEDDRVHVFYSSLYNGVTAKTLYHDVEDDAGSFAGQQTVATDISASYYNFYDGPPGFDWEEAGSVNSVGRAAENGTEILVPYTTLTAQAAARINLTTLTASTETISTAVPGGVEGRFAGPSAAQWTAGEWRVYYFEAWPIYDGINPILLETFAPHNMYRAQNSGAGWSTPNLIQTTTEAAPGAGTWPYTYSLNIDKATGLGIVNVKANSSGVPPGGPGQPGGGPNGMTVFEPDIDSQTISPPGITSTGIGTPTVTRRSVLYPYSYLGTGRSSGSFSGTGPFSLMA
jgi:hypothetical protein